MQSEPNDCGGADELCRAIVAEDCVVTIIALCNQVFSRFVLGDQSEPVAEIPAAWTLAQVAAERRHIADLRTGVFIRSFGQRGIILYDVYIVSQIAKAWELQTQESLGRIARLSHSF